MPTHNDQLQEIHDTIAAQLQENEECLESGWKRSEQFVLLSNQEIFVRLQSMMSSLEQELFGDTHGQKTKEVPDRNVSRSDNSKNGSETSKAPRVGDFSC